MHPYPSKLNALNRLQKFGLQIGTVIDVGVHEQTLELRQAFPDVHHILFEPAEDFHERIAQNYDGMSWELVPKAVSNRNDGGRLKKYGIDGGGVSHSTLVDPTVEGTLSVETTRLDTFLEGRSDNKPYLLKIDVDGYEVPIMQGLGAAAADVACLIVEATRETFVERINVAAEQGFQLIDIIDSCYYHGIFSQADLIFVSPTVANLPDMRPWQTKEFTWNKWVPIASFEGYIQSVVPEEDK